MPFLATNRQGLSDQEGDECLVIGAFSNRFEPGAVHWRIYPSKATNAVAVTGKWLVNFLVPPETESDVMFETLSNMIPGLSTKLRIPIIIGLVFSVALGSDGNPVQTEVDSPEVLIHKGQMIAPGVYQAKIRRQVDMQKEISPSKNLPVHNITANLSPIDPASIAGEQEWTAYLNEDFESGLLFTTWDLDYQGAGPWWDDWSCWANRGLRSVGCAAGGDNGITCGEAYPNNLWNWMVAGPFSFSNADITGAVLECFLNLDCETDKDFFFMGVSANGMEFEGNLYTGGVNGFVGIDLVESGILDGIMGLREVWVGFFFYSNDSGTRGNGAQIDDVVLAVDGLSISPSPEVTITAPNGGESWFEGSTQIITYVAHDPEDGPEPLKISLDYSTSSGYHWTPIETGQANTGSYDWKVPNLNSDFVKIRVRAFDGQLEGSDISDEKFSVIPPPINNHLALGETAGPSGTTVKVSLALDNQDTIGRLQADIVFDGTKCFYAGIDGAGRGSEFLADGEQVDFDRARIFLSPTEGDELQVGSGEICEIYFTLQGEGGGLTDLTLVDLILSDPDGDALGTDGAPGLLEVEPPLAVPELQISVLKNPVRTQTVTILVRIANGSGQAPTVVAAGIDLPMEALGEAVYVGTFSVPANLDTLEISAGDKNDLGMGTQTYTVTFP